MAPALDSGGTFLPKSYTRVALARAGRTSRTSNENNNTQVRIRVVDEERNKFHLPNGTAT